MGHALHRTIGITNCKGREEKKRKGGGKKKGSVLREGREVREKNEGMEPRHVFPGEAY